MRLVRTTSIKLLLLLKLLLYLGEGYGREVRTVSVDFSQGQSVYDDIQAEISDLDVAILGELQSGRISIDEQSYYKLATSILYQGDIPGYISDQVI